MSETIDIVRESYGRCLLKAEFFDEFYDIFMASSPQIPGFFANTNMVKQKQLLRDGISFMILFASEKRSGEMAIEKIGRLHDEDNVNVKPDLYKFWIRSLLKNIEKHDYRFDESVGKAWESILEPGIRKFVEMYKTS